VKNVEAGLVVLAAERPQRHDADGWSAVGSEPVEQRVRGIGRSNGDRQVAPSRGQIGDDPDETGQPDAMGRSAVKGEEQVEVCCHPRNGKDHRITYRRAARRGASASNQPPCRQTAERMTDR